ncbi:MAG TPA: hypothetical protein VGG06_15720 [Thermoanaerobaculia bacterium]
MKVPATPLTEGLTWPARWGPVIERMLDEVRSGSARAEAYWTQQLAFAPVFVHAVGLAVRVDAFSSDERDVLRGLLPLALSMLGPLPDGSNGDPAGLMILARRQAAALASGRRRDLARLARRLGLETPALTAEPVPRRFQRPYRLMGWRPPPAV